MIKDLFVILVIVSVNCDKACDVGEYLDYENCKCRKSLVDKLVDECDENIDEEIKILDKNKSKTCILYIVLFSIFFTMLKFLLILFTINTWIRIKKMFLNMIILIKQQFN